MTRKWLASWETDSFSDGVECDTLKEAKYHCLDCLEGWMVDEVSNLCDAVREGKKTRAEAVELWNYMISSCEVWVWRRDRAGEKWQEYWTPSAKELEDIGWKELEEWTMPEDT